MYFLIYRLLNEMRAIIMLWVKWSPVFKHIKGAVYCTINYSSFIIVDNIYRILHILRFKYVLFNRIKKLGIHENGENYELGCILKKLSQRCMWNACLGFKVFRFDLFLLNKYSLYLRVSFFFTGKYKYYKGQRITKTKSIN